MGNLHQLLIEASESLPSFNRTPFWTDPGISLLDDPIQIRKALDENASFLQAHPFTTEFLLLNWFPVLDKCWVISDRRQHNLNNTLFDAGYFPVGEGLNPTWHWGQDRFVRV